MCQPPSQTKILKEEVKCVCVCVCMCTPPVHFLNSYKKNPDPGLEDLQRLVLRGRQ